MMDHKPFILAIDDTPVNLITLGIALEAEFDLQLAASGVEGLSLAAQRAPDLILLDIMMPEMDGFETFRRFKTMPTLKHTPVVFITALSDLDSEMAGLELGAADYITKPIHVNITRQRIRNLIDRERLRRELESSNAQLKLTNTQLEQSHRQLRQSETMAAVGQLAAGVAHEINNPLGFVNANMGILKTYIDSLLTLIDVYERTTSPNSANESALLKTARYQADLDFMREDAPVMMAESLDGLNRVNKIVRGLRDFSRVDTDGWQESDLMAGLESTLTVARHQIKNKAEVIKRYSPLPPVSCHPAKINQVFLNLLINAVQAIEQRGTITLSSGVQDSWVWISIEDTGKGMSAELQKRIFEPFFTTKPLGQGTGLGLSLSYDIVKNHGGRIEVFSEPNQGTKVQVWLPVSNSDAVPENTSNI
jgi:signal transduction histidine kinase